MLGSAILVAALASSLFVDRTFDGSWYHLTGVLTLAEGWNPIRESLADWIRHASVFFQHGYAIHPTDQIVGFYADGAWSIGALFARIFSSINAAKAPNALWALSVFGIAYEFFAKTGFRPGTRLILAACYAITPVAGNQLFTLMVDGCVASIFLFSLMLLLVAYVDESKSDIVLLSGAILLLPTMKATGIAYACAFIFAIGLTIGIRPRLRQAVASGRKTISLFAFIYAASAAVLLWHPYATNALARRSPLYPFDKQMVRAIVDGNFFSGFSAWSFPKKIFYSYFSRTENTQTTLPILKIPGALYPWEFVRAGEEATRYGGFGPWFSLLLVILVALGIRALIRREIRVSNPSLAKPLALGCLFLVLASLSPGIIWARMIPFLGALPILAIALYKECRVASDRWLNALIAICALNAFFCFGSAMAKVARDTYNKRAFDRFAAESANRGLRIDAVDPAFYLPTAASIRFRLGEKTRIEPGHCDEHDVSRACFRYACACTL